MLPTISRNWQHHKLTDLSKSIVRVSLLVSVSSFIMVVTRNCTNTKKRVRTPCSKKRKEGRYQVALHVKTLTKRNPNADVLPVENPFVVEKPFLMGAGFHDFGSYLVKVVSECNSF